MTDYLKDIFLAAILFAVLGLLMCLKQIVQENAMSNVTSTQCLPSLPKETSFERLLMKESLKKKLFRWVDSLVKAREDYFDIKSRNGNSGATRIRVWYHEQFVKDLLALTKEVFEEDECVMEVSYGWLVSNGYWEKYCEVSNTDPYSITDGTVDKASLVKLTADEVYALDLGSL